MKLVAFLVALALASGVRAEVNPGLTTLYSVSIGDTHANIGGAAMPSLAKEQLLFEVSKSVNFANPLIFRPQRMEKLGASDMNAVEGQATGLEPLTTYYLRLAGQGEGATSIDAKPIVFTTSAPPVESSEIKVEVRAGFGSETPHAVLRMPFEFGGSDKTTACHFELAAKDGKPTRVPLGIPFPIPPTAKNEVALMQRIDFRPEDVYIRGWVVVMDRQSVHNGYEYIPDRAMRAKKDAFVSPWIPIGK